ncbi:MAG: AAA family ATPase, partial [Tannerellaceae bacterium]
MNLHNRLNVIVGINGTGKTAVLEALRIAIGSLFLGVNKYKDKISSPGINPDDARLSNLEPQIPVFINAEGEINEFEASNNTCRSLSWERSLETWGGKTRYVNAKDMVT